MGTTNSCVAVCGEDGKPRVLADERGGRTIPSMVARAPSGEWLVGTAAKRQAVTNAHATAFGVKRLIGRKHGDPAVRALQRLVPFRVIAGDRGDAWVELSGHAVAPQEIAARVLAHIKGVAETRLGQPVAGAVVTVPAYFDDAQRQATRDAGVIAGLEVRAVLNEPTAAALAYGPHRDLDRATVAVFDLGGGTFDVSILRVEAGVYEVLATSGDTLLGGDDIDACIVDALLARVHAEHGVDLAGDATVLQRLKETAETLKRELSSMTTAAYQLPFLGAGPAGPIHAAGEMARAELEGLAAPLLDGVEGPCRDALAEAGVEAGGVDCVILVGGMTRMPAIQQRVEALFGRRPARDVNPDEIVALGAAMHAAVLDGTRDQIALLDVTPHSLGIEVNAGRMSVVVRRNTTIPIAETRTYKTLEDSQTHVQVEVYQGEAEHTADNRRLGTFTLRGLPPRTAGDVKVDVTFRVDTDGIVRVEAREHETGAAAEVEVAPDSGLTAEQLQALVFEPLPAAPAGAPSAAPSPTQAPAPPAPGEAGAAAATAAEDRDDDDPGDDFFGDAHTLRGIRALAREAVAQARAELAGPRTRRPRTSTRVGYVSERTNRVTSAFGGTRGSDRLRALRATREPRKRPPTMNPTERDYRDALESDLFARLGLHWTDAPRRLDGAIEQQRRKFGAGSPAAQQSPEFAQKRLELAEEAHATLSTVAARRRYRADQLKVDTRSAAELLTQQARLDIRRGDVRGACEKLEAAMDLDPTQARQKLLATVRAQLG